MFKTEASKFECKIKKFVICLEIFCQVNFVNDSDLWAAEDQWYNYRVKAEQEGPLPGKSFWNSFSDGGTAMPF